MRSGPVFMGTASKKAEIRFLDVETQRAHLVERSTSAVQAIGEEIANEFKREGVQAAILTST